jgi:hypothetical protein
MRTAQRTHKDDSSPRDAASTSSHLLLQSLDHVSHALCRSKVCLSPRPRIESPRCSCGVLAAGCANPDCAIRGQAHGGAASPHFQVGTWPVNAACRLHREPDTPPRCLQKNRPGRVGEPGLGCVARARVLRRADLDAASDARRGPWRPSSSLAVEARAAPWASEMRKHDLADDPRDPADHRHCHSDAHHSSSSHDGWHRDREGQRPQQNGCPRERFSSSQIRPCDEIGVGRPRHWHSVRRVAHGPIVARHEPSASERQSCAPMRSR